MIIKLDIHDNYKCLFWWCIIAVITLNICSFVHQCNTFTFYFLLFVDMFRPHTAIFRCYSLLSRSWCSVMPIFAYVMVPAMCFCWWCAYCQCPCVIIFVLSLWPPCCLFTSVCQYIAVICPKSGYPWTVLDTGLVDQQQLLHWHRIQLNKWCFWKLRNKGCIYYKFCVKWSLIMHCWNCVCRSWYIFSHIQWQTYILCEFYIMYLN
jgi:hypothetical protein